MYKKNQNRQYQFTDFNQPVGLKMDPENRWVKKAAMIPFLTSGKEISTKHRDLLKVILKVYEQQQYMYTNRTHSVEDRIVNISQPYIRPIVRGKAKSPTEFGTKLDLSIDANGLARIEKQSFDAYNESDVLIGAIERYHERTGHYPERVLVDKIYRNRKNLSFCKKRRDVPFPCRSSR